jgi:hypothetical protein
MSKTAIIPKVISRTQTATSASKPQREAATALLRLCMPKLFEERSERLPQINIGRRSRPETRFGLPPSHSPLSPSLYDRCIEKGRFALSFKPLHPTIKPRLDLAIRPWREGAYLNWASKFIECLLHNLSSSLRIASLAFVINCKLFVCLTALPRISDRIVPELTTGRK